MKKVVVGILVAVWVLVIRSYEIKKNFRCKLKHLLQVLNHEIRLIGTFPREPN